ncbi:Homeobox protein orthopedia, partial [Ophiophagus hannah]
GRRRTPARPDRSRASKSRNGTGRALPRLSSTSWSAASPRPTTRTSSCERSWLCASASPSRES